jgi:hypothetical protein
MQEAPKSWMDRLAEHLGKNPLMDRIKSLQNSETARRMSESFQDVKDKLEHSENEMIGRIHDVRQRLTEENEAAVAYRELRMRHPSFDMPTFLRSIKQDVPVVIQVGQATLCCVSLSYTSHQHAQAEAMKSFRACIIHTESQMWC